MPRPTVRIFGSDGDLALAAAELIVERITRKPNLVLGLATGSTPLGLYRELIQTVRDRRVSLADVTTFNLDEYVGLPSDHPQSYRAFMWTNLFSNAGIPAERIHLLNGMASNLETECMAYEASIARAGRIDVQILGIGRNGHIAFNEPGSAFDSRTRVVRLNDDTIQANSDGRFFTDPNEVPTQALTMGIGTILEAREILLLATGASKRDAIRRSLREFPNVNVPASALQRHPNVSFFLDQAAAPEVP